MIKATNLVKKYVDESGEIIPVNKLDLQLEYGRFVSITGRSGSGKSTLLKMLGGLIKPDEGKVLVEEISLYDMKEKDMARYRSKHIGFVFQDYFLEEMFTVYQNVEIALMISGVKPSERKDMIEAALEGVGLLDRKKSLVGSLSGGEKQRVSIARAIVNAPKVILADEPCGNLDSENGRVVMALLRKQVEAGKLVVLVTHNREDAELTDEIITLQDGRIVNHEVK